MGGPFEAYATPADKDGTKRVCRQMYRTEYRKKLPAPERAAARAADGDRANLKITSTSERALAEDEPARPRSRDGLLRATERAHIL